ncbi:MAG: class I SAM-dependent methyltransferase [Gemmatimonadota bacterium]
MTMLLDYLLDSVIRTGTLKVIDADGRIHTYNEGNGKAVTIRLHDEALHWKLFFNPTLYIGEAYMDGLLTIEEGTLQDFIDLCGLNLPTLEAHPVLNASQRISKLARRIQQYNPRGVASGRVAHHYDLSNTLYELFLDEDLQYSCGYFTGNEQTLEQAQANKKRHIASKLVLDRVGLKVLDIGSGWGGLAIYLARLAEADVTGITLSSEQHKAARRRAVEFGVADRVEFHLRDYRDETEEYDRIVSVGMFEHVGVTHYREFFTKLKELLKTDGIALLHSIARMEPPGNTNPWIRKYIFPGGYCPAMSEVLAAAEDVGLWVTDIEILRLHYAETLAEWCRRFERNRDQAKKLYDERFCRMWEFYLASCEAGFRYTKQMVFQMQLTRSCDAAPLTRDYMLDRERAYI